MIINNKFNIGDRVYLVTDSEQRAYMVLEIYVGVGMLAYKIVNGTCDYVACEIELSKDKDTLITL